MVLTRVVRGGLAAAGSVLRTGRRLLTQPIRIIGIGKPDRRPVRPSQAAVADNSRDGPRSAERRTTVRFAVDGQNYDVDLSPEAADGLRAVFRPYIDAGRRVDAITPRRRGDGGVGRPGPRPARHDPAAIREWARAHGYQVSDRGRIPTRVLEAYRAAK